MIIKWYSHGIHSIETKLRLSDMMMVIRVCGSCMNVSPARVGVLFDMMSVKGSRYSPTVVGTC